MKQAGDAVATAKVRTSTTAPSSTGGASMAGSAPAAPAALATQPNALRREVFGFALASSLNDPTVGYPSWNFNLLSTVAFFGLHVNDDGTIAGDSGLTVWNSTQLTDLVTAAHSHGVKVVLTVIKQDFNSGTPDMCAALAQRATTVSQTVAQVSAKGVDGVNLDYEGLNGTCPNGQAAQSMMTDLARQMRAGLPSGSYLSVDTYASSAADSLGFFDVPGLNAYVDSFFVMAYDLEYSNYNRAPTSCAQFCLGPTAPLTSYYYNDTNTAAQYTSAVGAGKVILGVPYYGRKACVGSASANQFPTGSVTADTYLDAISESSQPQVQPGSYVSHRDANDPSGQERWDTWYNTTLACTRELYWDDTVSLGKKYDLVNSDGLRGVGIWNLNYGGGASELWSTLQNHFVACTSASVTPQPGSFSAGTTIAFTATAAGCSNPEYEYWFLPPGSYWQVMRAYSPIATFSWNTAGLTPGAYQVAIWVRQQGGGTATYDAGAGGTYTLTGCTGASVSPGPGSFAVTSTLNFTATGTGCGNPEFEYWMLAPGGYWRMVQAYSSNPSFSWNTTGLTPGTYQVVVWVRQHGSGTATYEAGAGGNYVLTGCGSATLTPVPGSYPVTSTLGFTATAAGCSTPDYEFWVLAPGASWRMVQAYSSNPNFSWNTMGLAPGTYQVVVWVRQHGSGTATYEAGAGGNYVLTGCSSATLSPAPGSFARGTAVSFVAGSSGCANPEYEYWVLAPGGYWQLLRAYGPAAFNWNTAGLPPGTYQIAVWVRQQGSGTPSYDAGAGGAYKLS